MSPRQRATKKITVTLPIEDAEAVERLAESGQVESVSRYVTEYALQWARNLVARRLGPQGPTA